HPPTAGKAGPEAGKARPPRRTTAGVPSARPRRRGFRHFPPNRPGKGANPCTGGHPLIAVAVSRPSTLPLDALHAGFLTIRPRIELHGHIHFRHLRCAAQRADAVAEVVALSWSWYVRLAERGTDATRFPRALATFAARAVRAGRRLCGRERARDVL